MGFFDGDTEFGSNFDSATGEGSLNLPGFPSGVNIDSILNQENPDNIWTNDSNKYDSAAGWIKVDSDVYGKGWYNPYTGEFHTDVASSDDPDTQTKPSGVAVGLGDDISADVSGKSGGLNPIKDLLSRINNASAGDWIKGILSAIAAKKAYDFTNDQNQSRQDVANDIRAQNATLLANQMNARKTFDAPAPEVSPLATAGRSLATPRRTA